MLVSSNRQLFVSRKSPEPKMLTKFFCKSHYHRGFDRDLPFFILLLGNYYHQCLHILTSFQENRIIIKKNILSCSRHVQEVYFQNVPLIFAP